VLSQTYGAFADLRRELSDSKETVGGREELLKTFALCPIRSARGWRSRIILKNCHFTPRFPDTNWWPRLLNAQGKARLEDSLFCSPRQAFRAAELQAHASPTFCPAEEAEKELNLVKVLENWLSPPPCRCSTRRAHAGVVCRVQPDDEEPSASPPGRAILLLRPRTGEKARTLREF